MESVLDLEEADAGGVKVEHPVMLEHVRKFGCFSSDEAAAG